MTANTPSLFKYHGAGSLWSHQLYGQPECKHSLLRFFRKSICGGTDVSFGL